MVGKNSIDCNVHMPWVSLSWVSCGIVMEGVNRICWRKKKKLKTRLYTSTDTELARQRREGQLRNK